MRKILKSNRGETLLESILSVFIFSIVVLAVTTMTVTALKITQKTTLRMTELNQTLTDIDKNGGTGDKKVTVKLDVLVMTKQYAFELPEIGIYEKGIAKYK